MTEQQHDALLDAILPHVSFDGWSEKSFAAAADEIGLTLEEAQALCPRGAKDLAMCFHRRGDAAMIASLNEIDLDAMRIRDRVATALKLRMHSMEPHREAVRRASTLFALPSHTADGAKLVWETADHIWTALGDTSRDVNWYTKRATLSAVWASTVLFWLGDDSPRAINTEAFIDRRIDNVMQFEKAKASMRENPLTKPLMALQASLFSKVRAPSENARDDMPGRWVPPNA